MPCYEPAMQQCLSELPVYEYSVNARDVAARQRLNSAFLHDRDQRGHGPEVGQPPRGPKTFFCGRSWVFQGGE
jgi:hypothetical protein